MQQSRDAERAVRTDQLTDEISVHAGEKNNVVVREIQLDKANARLHMVCHNTNKSLPKGVPSSYTVVDDGKFAYFYNPEDNTYQKAPRAQDFALNQMLAQSQQPAQSKQALGHHFNYIGTDEVGGRAVDVIEPIFPPMPKDRPVPSVRMYLDAKTHLMVRVTSTSLSDNGGHGKMAMTVTESMKNEVINAPIAESAFAFTPPAGAKEVTTPAPAKGPGAQPGQQAH